MLVIEKDFYCINLLEKTNLTSLATFVMLILFITFVRWVSNHLPI